MLTSCLNFYSQDIWNTSCFSTTPISMSRAFTVVTNSVYYYSAGINFTISFHSNQEKCIYIWKSQSDALISPIFNSKIVQQTLQKFRVKVRWKIFREIACYLLCYLVYIWMSIKRKIPFYFCNTSCGRKVMISFFY